jgi:hypothetical protein
MELAMTLKVVFPGVLTRLQKWEAAFKAEDADSGRNILILRFSASVLGLLEASS